jgi:hypothetical protein
MNSHLTPRQWEQLSAYLDGELRGGSQVQLERMLESDPLFRESLESLKKTRAALRSVRNRPVPRNFMLSPSDAVLPRRIWRGWMPVFSFSSAIASLLMLFSLYMGLVRSPVLTTQMEIASAPLEQPAEKIMTESDIGPSDLPPIIIWGGPQAYSTMPMGKGGGGGGNGGDAPLLQVAPEAGSVDQPLPVPSGQEQEQPAPALVLPPSPQSTSADQFELLPLEGNGPILGVPPGGGTEPRDQQRIPASEEPELPAAALPPGVNWILLMAIFALIALTTGGFAIVLRRTSRR